MLSKGFFKTLFGFSAIVLFGVIIFFLASGYLYEYIQKNEGTDIEVLSN